MSHIRKVVRAGRKTAWRCTYIDPSGQRKTKHFDRATDAEAFRKKIEGDIVRGTYVDPDAGRIELREYWTTRIRPGLGTRLRPSTLASYDLAWKRYLEPALGGHRLAGITRLDVQRMRDELVVRGIGAATVRGVMLLLHRILNDAVADELVFRNVASGVRPPRTGEDEARFLSPGEVDRLVDAVPDEWRAFVLVAAWGGLRFGEIVALRVERVDFLRRTLRVEDAYSEVGGELHLGPTKTRQKRTVALPEFVVTALSEHLRRWPASDDGLVFHNKSGGPIRRSHFRPRVWVPALERAELGVVRFHDLRHTAAALAIAAGAHPKALQARLGHTQSRTTFDNYGHLLEGIDADIARGLETMARRTKPETAAGAER